MEVDSEVGKMFTYNSKAGVTLPSGEITVVSAKDHRPCAGQFNRLFLEGVIEQLAWFSDIGREDCYCCS